MLKKINSYVVKVVGDNCNLRCVYCYYESHKEKSMSLIDIENMIKNMVEYAEYTNHPTVVITWHGGEPLLYGLENYKKIIKIQKQHKKIKFINKVQTNGTMIDEEWIKIFKKNNFRVGVSFDGNEESHNKTRDNSYNEVISAIKLLKKHNIQMGTLAVCSYDLLTKNPEKIIDLLIGLGVDNFDFKPYYHKELELEKYNKAYANFIIKAFKYFLKLDDPNLNFRLLYSIIDKVLGATESNLCIFNPQCGLFPSINSNGNIYRCDNYDVKNMDSYLGNILEESLVSIMASDKYKAAEKRFNNFKKREGCQDCDVKYICNGGCPNNSDMTHNKMLFCEAYKKIFKYVEKVVNSQKR